MIIDKYIIKDIQYISYYNILQYTSNIMYKNNPILYPYIFSRVSDIKIFIYMF